ncbi:hypothetical protein HHK36_029170 [Tetracentron sinense]|uniref:Transcriptional coactivator p15 (PC4) C-terminal domain-containing protein n=1 Tax=Tetracentron sinense TaxID=13715 RepID=A0A835D470_TETSI|nr:hypothetical protein HHK36_029170 [Tetracentron sinense]
MMTCLEWKSALEDASHVGIMAPWLLAHIDELSSALDMGERRCEVNKERLENVSGIEVVREAKGTLESELLETKLSNKRKVTIQDFRGKTLVSIREYYERDGKELPSSKGISLTNEQWAAFSKNVPAIDEAIRKMESRSR